MTAAVTIPAPRYPAKIATPGDALARIAGLPRPLVFTNGVFDVLHRGHVTCLDQARGAGRGAGRRRQLRRLRCGASARLPTGRSIRSPTGWPSSPALAAVDLVVPFDADTPRDLIAACLPDVLVKGGDYTAETTAGAAEVIAAGGKFVAIPFATTHSTSALIAKIRERGNPQQGTL